MSRIERRPSAGASTGDSRDSTRESVLAQMTLNPLSGERLYAQIVRQVRHRVATGELGPGAALPTTDVLAEHLEVSPNTVAKAYTELQRAGVIVARHGSEAHVASPTSGGTPTSGLRSARARVHHLVHELRGEGVTGEEIRRLFEAELCYRQRTVTRTFENRVVRPVRRSRSERPKYPSV